MPSTSPCGVCCCCCLDYAVAVVFFFYRDTSSSSSSSCLSPPAFLLLRLLLLPFSRSFFRNSRLHACNAQNHTAGDDSVEAWTGHLKFSKPDGGISSTIDKFSKDHAQGSHGQRSPKALGQAVRGESKANDGEQERRDHQWTCEHSYQGCLRQRGVLADARSGGPRRKDTPRARVCVAAWTHQFFLGWRDPAVCVQPVAWWKPTRCFCESLFGFLPCLTVRVPGQSARVDAMPWQTSKKPRRWYERCRLAP